MLSHMVPVEGALDLCGNELPTGRNLVVYLYQWSNLLYQLENRIYSRERLYPYSCR